ncbi:MAG: hypothetical protein PVJ49_12310 [Acidobacteriota bacterium]|jgi:hypothetical protein
MSKREIVAIVVLLIAGFLAYEMMRVYEVTDPDEVAPGETPQAATGDEPAETAMQALVPAVRMSELYDAVATQHALPPLPQESGLLAVAGNPGEILFTRHYPGRAEVCVMRAGAIDVLWITATDQILEIVGEHGPELLLKFIDAPFDGPVDAWQPGGFYGLDLLATDEGVHPVKLDDATVAALRAVIR